MVVSRGELIEIGGGFRIPDVLARSGARLVEVGTTNRTRAADYERAVGRRRPRCCCESTSRTTASSASPSAVARRARGRRARGTACRSSTTSAAARSSPFEDEPSPRESLAAGADLVCFSGDKLLGGPQAGIVVGRGDLVERLRRHPLQRALRADKLTLAALEGTLALYLDPERAAREVPVLRMLREPVDGGARARRAARRAASAARSRRPSAASAAARCRSPRCRASRARSRSRSRRRCASTSRRSSASSARAACCSTAARSPTARSTRSPRAVVAAVPDRRWTVPLTVGTAGHIDHGKTWLVRALTGKDTDRLPEEQARGISIDLGYAPLELPDGERLSLVDVPGHERFVRNMVAGATGIDLFLLVIDAAEGARPQTLEHLAILRLLGIDRGVVAVTKADTVDDETLELAVEEAHELVPGGRGRRGQRQDRPGLDELRAALARAAAATRRAARSAARASTSTASSRSAGSAPSSPARCGRARSASATSCASSRAGATSACARCRCTKTRSSAREAGQRVAVSLPGIERRTSSAATRSSSRASTRHLPPRRPRSTSSTRRRGARVTVHSAPPTSPPASPRAASTRSSG